MVTTTMWLQTRRIDKCLGGFYTPPPLHIHTFIPSEHSKYTSSLLLPLSCLQWFRLGIWYLSKICLHGFEKLFLWIYFGTLIGGLLLNYILTKTVLKMYVVFLGFGKHYIVRIWHWIPNCIKMFTFLMPPINREFLSDHFGINLGHILTT